MNSRKQTGYLILVTGLVVGLIGSGCATVPAVLPGLLPTGGTSVGVLTSTSIDLSKANYRIVRPNVVGTSKGFKLLGLITLKSSNYTKAMTHLYEQAQVAEGRPQAIANIVHERGGPYFILFSLPRVRVRADLIEFIGESESTNHPPAGAGDVGP